CFIAPRRSAVPGVRLPVGRDFLFVAVTDGEEHLLGEVQVAPLLAVVLVDVRLDDGIHRAGFLAESAEDALREIDIVTGGAPGAVLALGGLDRDRERRADRLAQLARDAALLPVGIAPQGMQPAEPGRHRRLLLGVLDRDLAREEIPPREL